MTPSALQWIIIACVALGSLLCTVIVVGVIIGGAREDDDD